MMRIAGLRMFSKTGQAVEAKGIIMSEEEWDQLRI
jgi:hypothetical protein